MKRSDIFTVPDKNITSDGAVDPMGMQLIWTYFGQKIFNKKLTTVSTDARNYTINLLHHYVLYQLEAQGELRYAMEKYSAYKSEYLTKAGLVIFMENLLVYSLMDQDQQDTVNTIGILGRNKAQKNLAGSKYHQIKIEAEVDKEILVRQIQLGVNGRYKGPFMMMKIIGLKNLNYFDEEFRRIKNDVFDKWEEGRKLADELIEIIKKLLKNGSGEHPVATLDNYKEHKTLWSLYAKCFGQIEVNDTLKNYWSDMLGITTGAASAIYSAATEHNSRSEVIKLACQVDQSPEQLGLLQDILQIEPFLSRCMHAFQLTIDKSCSEISKIKKELNKLRKDLPIKRAVEIAYNSKDPEDDKNKERLKMLVRDLKGNTTSNEKFITAIISYHTKVMKDRGGSAWVELGSNKQIKHNVHQTTRAPIDKVVSGEYWYNSYYIDAIKSIKKGLNP